MQLEHSAVIRHEGRGVSDRPSQSRSRREQGSARPTDHGPRTRRAAQLGLGCRDEPLQCRDRQPFLPHRLRPVPDGPGVSVKSWISFAAPRLVGDEQREVKRLAARAPCRSRRSCSRTTLPEKQARGHSHGSLPKGHGRYAPSPEQPGCGDSRRSDASKAREPLLEGSKARTRHPGIPANRTSTTST